MNLMNQIISQDLQMGQVNKKIMDVIRRNIFICVYWMDLTNLTKKIIIKDTFNSTTIINETISKSHAYEAFNEQ
ncbi:hypothetical protein RFI_35197 [Reticulomyxa filosa]|uniref:Uncharacterized protein n=1 Tax=Reticulomyxa filosa TaxID=46433 RepID=X6LKT9_RETFI|nr:hypothetical protein RFI_35197 [Reticulomyxa filosa]|eukprot:ETO02239.1 hypothetical protein RFI_35197 [Reticulomyxa filosa]